MARDMSIDKKSDSEKMSITDIFKVVATLIGVLTFLISLLTAIIQYRQSVQQDMDKSFRAVVEKLSSEEKEQRLAAASSTGTFIIKGGKYYQEAIDILINRLSIELNYNVLNAIKGSLERIAQEDSKKTIEKLLEVDRNRFIQEYALKEWSRVAKQQFDESEQSYRQAVLSYQDTPTEADKEMIDNLRNKMNAKWQSYNERQNAFDELSMHKQVISDFLSIFLSTTKNFPIEGLTIFRNSMNSVSLMDLNFIKSEIKSSSISSTNVWETRFDGSSIKNTFFSYSDIRDTSFVNCTISSSLFNEARLKRVDFSGSEFKNVFFIGTDLTGSRFTNTKGLEPIFFHRATNLDKAIFDPSFKKILEDTKITDQQYMDYIKEHNVLDESNKTELFNAIDRVTGNLD